MAAINATSDPVYGQLFRLAFVILDSATARPITGGLTGLSARVSKDAGAFGTTTNTPVEIGTNGYGYIELTAAEMTAYDVILEIRATNSGSVYYAKEICPRLMSPFTGRFDAQTVKRYEQMMLDFHAIVYGQVTDSGAAYTVLNTDATAKVSGTLAQTDTSAVRGLLS